jgi:hypothetical protein
MKERYSTLVKCFHYKGHEYAIIQGLHDGIIRAIDYKYLDDNGLLIKPLNGLQMFCDHRANTVPQILERIKDHIDWEEYVAEHNLSEADQEVFVKACVDFFGKRATV